MLLQPTPVSGHGPALGREQGAAGRGPAAEAVQVGLGSRLDFVRLLGIKAAVGGMGRGVVPIKSSSLGVGLRKCTHSLGRGNASFAPRS